jgi:hypothetical protein
MSGKTEEIRADKDEAVLTIKLMRDGSMQMSLPTEMLASIPELLEESAAKIRRELRDGVAERTEP